MVLLLLLLLLRHIHCLFLNSIKKKTLIRSLLPPFSIQTYFTLNIFLTSQDVALTLPISVVIHVTLLISACHKDINSSNNNLK